MKILNGMRSSFKRPTVDGFIKAQNKVMPIVWVITIVAMGVVLALFTLDLFITMAKWDEQAQAQTFSVEAVQVNSLPVTGSIKLLWDSPLVAASPFVISSTQQITLNIFFSVSYRSVDHEQWPDTVYEHQIPVYQTALQTQTLQSQAVPGTGLLKEIVYSVPLTLPVQGAVEERVRLYVGIPSQFSQVDMDILDDGVWLPWDGSIDQYWRLIVDGEVVIPDEDGWVLYRILAWPYRTYLPIVLSN